MIEEIEDITDEELKRIAEEKRRHKELISAINKAFKNNEKDLSPEIQRNNDLIVSLIEKVSNIRVEQKALPAPQVNVTTDNKRVIEEIKSLNETVKELIKNQEKIIDLLSLKPNKLEVIRNPILGTINYVEVKYKNV